MRVAICKSHPAIEAYMPGNYVTIDRPDGETTYIVGEDRAGWTLDGYVIPRLASGLHFARELTSEANLKAAHEAIGDFDRAVLIEQARAIEGDVGLLSADGPGRFEGASDRELTAALDVLAGMGVGDESAGNVDIGTHGVRFGRYVLTTDSNGFVSTEVFDDAEYAERFVASLDPEDVAA